MKTNDWINTLKIMAMLENETQLTLGEWLAVAKDTKDFDIILETWLENQK